MPRTETANLMSLAMVVNAIFLPIGTYFTAKGTNPKIMILAGGSVFVILMYSASCTTSYQAFKWLYPLAWSFNNGIAYYAACNEAWKFFPDKPGFASGIILAGFGCGSFFFDNLSTYIINPNDYAVGSPEFDEAVQTRFVLMLRWLIVCFSVIILIGIITVWKGPDKLADKITQLREEDEGINKSRLTDLTNTSTGNGPPSELDKTFDPSAHASTAEMLFSTQSAILYVVAVMSIMTGFFVVNQTKNFGVLNGLTDD